MNVTGELEKAAQTYELWQENYSRDVAAYGNLGVLFQKLGNYEGELEQMREAMRLEPDAGLAYINLAGAYQNLNRFDEAEAVYKQAQERKLMGGVVLVGRYHLAFDEQDPAKMAEVVTAAMGKPGIEDVLLAAQADTEAWYGKLKNARLLTQRAMDSAQHNDAIETAAIYRAGAALREVEVGNGGHSRADANAALKLSQNRDVRIVAALTLARAGDTPAAGRLAGELDRQFPLDTLVQKYWLPTIRAAIALDRKDPNRAVELLEVARPLDLSGNLCSVYVRGEAYLKLHDGKAAAAEFQKYIDHAGVVVNFPWGALARLGSARAYALDASTSPAARDKARKAYEDFLTLWKDADPDIPIYKQAKTEYAKLQ
jgi:tetratricopeptide (TPR) repeat protein